MKVTLINIFLLISGLIHSQQYLDTRKIYNLNNSYCLEITGYVWDGFSGECQYVLKDSIGRLHWEKSLIFGGMPIVSMKGDVVIPTKTTIYFFNNSGNEKGKFNKGYRPNGYRFPLSGCADPDWHETPHSFSQNGDRYFILTGNESMDTTKLYCLTSKAEELWNTEFINYCPDNISFLNNIVLIDNFDGAGFSINNSLKLLNIDSGEKIKNFDIDIKNPYIKHLIIEDSTFLLYNRDLQLYNSNGEFTKNLNEVEIKNLLYSENDDLIIIGLHYFNNYGDISALSSEYSLLCELLFKDSLKRSIFLIESLLEKMEVECENK